jgi:hypothetical protein
VLPLVLLQTLCESFDSLVSRTSTVNYSATSNYSDSPNTSSSRYARNNYGNGYLYLKAVCLERTDLESISHVLGSHKH